MFERSRFTGTIKRVIPGVVSIVISKHLEDLEKEHASYSFVPGHAQAKKNNKNISANADKNGLVRTGGGSGFIADSSGLVLSNKHVLDDPTASYVAILNDGRKIPASVLSSDPINDVSILKLEGKNLSLPTVRLGDSSHAELGEEVLAIGNALGIFKNTVSLGIVSGLSRSVSAKENPKGPAHELRGLIQTDAAINLGNSGGPLVNLRGEAIGINVATIPGAQNIGFAIPINAAKRDLSDLKKYGRIRRPYLGVRYMILDENLKDKLKLPSAFGAWVIRETPHDSAIVPGSPAEKAGLAEKDIILECNGKKIDLDHPLQDTLDDLTAGDKLKLLVLRGKKQLKLALTLAERK